MTSVGQAWLKRHGESVKPSPQFFSPGVQYVSGVLRYCLYCICIAPPKVCIDGYLNAACASPTCDCSRSDIGSMCRLISGNFHLDMLWR